MEVIGALASFIAIGQAIGAIPKFTKAIRIVSNSRKELQDLLFELEILVAGYSDIKETLGLFSPEGTAVMIAYEEPYYMIILRGKLEALLEQLEALAKDCQKLAEEPPPRKSFRAIWPWKRRKVLELYEEARLIQGHLNSAMGVFMNRALYNQGKLLAHIHDAVVGSSPRLTDDTNDNGTDIYGPKTLLGDLHPAFRISDPTSDVSRLYLLPSKKQQKNPCICSCHRPQARRTREVAYAPIPGKLSVSHSNVIDWIFPCRKCECSRPRALIRLDYQFPPWLWNRALVFKTSLSVLSGIGISLRIPTILRSNDPIWPALRSPRIEDVQRFISQKSYTATDTDRQGGSILEYAMSYDQYAIVLVLLDRFTHILKDTAAANNATIRARAALFGREKTLPEFEAYVLNRVVELADDEAEGRPLMLHEAVRNAGDLSTAIETDASTIDDLDMAGFTALHLACLYDNFDALKFLIRNRAKVHTTDRQGDTPLHLAASRGQVAFAACLLDAGSDINQRGLNGETPLHKACRSVILDDDSQIVEYLLGRGAAASACNNYGESVLHLLANQPRSSQAVRRRADVLMQFGAWAMVDTQNHFGNTPLLKAIWEVNDTMVPLLLAAGARCDLSNSKRLNVLHAAGRIGNRTIINCLRKAELSGPDFRSKTTDGLTPIGELRRAIYRDRHMVSEMVKDRNPTPDEISAFEALLREVRNRGVIAEVAKLEDVIADIESMAVMKARESLKELTRSKREAGIEEEMKIIRKADLNVKQDSLQQAVQTLKEYIAVAKSRMKISPFEEEENPWVKLKEMEETNYKDGTKELSSDEDEYESCVE